QARNQNNEKSTRRAAPLWPRRKRCNYRSRAGRWHDVRHPEVGWLEALRPTFSANAKLMRGRTGSDEITVQSYQNLAMSWGDESVIGEEGSHRRAGELSAKSWDRGDRRNFPRCGAPVSPYLEFELQIQKYKISFIPCPLTLIADSVKFKCRRIKSENGFRRPP